MIFLFFFYCAAWNSNWRNTQDEEFSRTQAHYVCTRVRSTGIHHCWEANFIWGGQLHSSGWSGVPDCCLLCILRELSQVITCHRGASLHSRAPSLAAWCYCKKRPPSMLPLSTPLFQTHDWGIATVTEEIVQAWDWYNIIIILEVIMYYVYRNYYYYCAGIEYNVTYTILLFAILLWY